MKNKTIQLVNEWASFEELRPEGDIADFCRYYLTRQKGAESGAEPAEKALPGLSGELMRIIARLGKLNTLYVNLALKESELGQVEEFGMLYTIGAEKNPKKSEVIRASLLELSSGTDMLNRMKRRGLIKETTAREDKRVKRVMLTAKGMATLDSSFRKIEMNAEMLTAGLTADEKKLIIHLLKDIALKFSSRWPSHKDLLPEK